jgi:hypothetical protein
LLRQARGHASVNAIDGIVRVNQMGAVSSGAAGLAAAVGYHAAYFAAAMAISQLRAVRAPVGARASRRALQLGAVPVLLLVAIAA